MRPKPSSVSRDQPYYLVATATSLFMIYMDDIKQDQIKEPGVKIFVNGMCGDFTVRSLQDVSTCVEHEYSYHTIYTFFHPNINRGTCSIKCLNFHDFFSFIFSHPKCRFHVNLMHFQKYPYVYGRDSDLFVLAWGNLFDGGFKAVL